MSLLWTLTAVALAGALVWLATLTLPVRQAVRVRNAFLLRRGVRADFDWTPENVPARFRLETTMPPSEIADAVRSADVRRITDDWQRARALAGLLVQHAKEDAPIRADLLTTWRGIRDGGGYCSDYVRVYMATASAAGLFCRQWSFSFDGFGGHGHTFVEVYDRATRRWTFLDPHNNVYAVDSRGTPLDAMTLREALLGDASGVEFRQAAPGRLGWPHFDKLLEYYRRGAHQWYLWWGNDVVAREQRGIVSALCKASPRLAHRAAGVLGGLPPLVVLPSCENESAIVAMERLKGRVRTAVVLAIACALLLLLQRSVGAIRHG